MNLNDAQHLQPATPTHSASAKLTSPVVSSGEGLHAGKPRRTARMLDAFPVLSPSSSTCGQERLVSRCRGFQLICRKVATGRTL